MKPHELSFDTLCRFFDALLDPRVKHNTKNKYDALRHFIDQNIVRSSHSAYDVFRLVLPLLDNERGAYRLLESKLHGAWCRAFGVESTHPIAKAVAAWKKPGVGRDAGNFAALLEEELFRKMRKPADPKAVKIAEVNQILQELVECAGDPAKQGAVLCKFALRCSSRQCFWLTQIILKSLKLGVSEKTIFKTWHPDAEEYFNATMSLKAVFNEMIDPSRPWRCDIEPGKPVRPQLARMTLSPASAFKLMHYPPKDARAGELRPFILETKFDGERIQVHRLADGRVQYYSRKAIEHGEHSSYNVLDAAMLAAMGSHEKCILDGELVVWNKKK